MKVTSDMVKDLQKRVDVTYEEAERILIKTSGNIDKAEHLINRRRNSKTSRFMDEAERIYKELLTYYFKITRKEEILVNVPLLVVVGLFLVMTMDTKIWVGIITIGLILLSESDVSIYRGDVDDEGIVQNEPEKKTKTKKDEDVTTTEAGPSPETVDEKDVVLEATDTREDKEVIKKKDDDDDYYEITIEK